MATFSKAGTYTLTATIADSYGQFTTSSIAVTVNQTFTRIAVALAANDLATTGMEQFTATADDQFGQAMTTQPTFIWGVTGGGTIDSNGDYQPPYATGSAIIRAMTGGVTGQATATYPGFAQWNSAGSGSWAPRKLDRHDLGGRGFAAGASHRGRRLRPVCNVRRDDCSDRRQPNSCRHFLCEFQQLHAVRRRDESRQWSKSGHDR